MSEDMAKPARVPRYRDLSRAVWADIASGALREGDKLPTEASLCRRFGVSRHTVRTALRDLLESGLIASRQGARSVVLRRSPAAAYTCSISSLDELLHYATEVRYEVSRSGMVVADQTLSARLAARPGQRWLRVEGTRAQEREAEPVCWTEVFVHADYAGIGLLIGRKKGAIHTWIEEMYGVRIDEVKQILSVEPMTPDVAASLGCAPQTMGVCIRRSYFLEDGTLVEVAFNQHRADRFRHELTLRKRG